MFLVEEHVRGRVQLRRVERELRARGEKLTIAELVPPKLAPEENGMRALLAARQFEPPYVPSMRFVAPGCAVVSSRLEQWTGYGNSKTNTWDDVRAWKEIAAPSLEAIRAALQKPAFDADIQWQRGFEMLLPHLTEIKGSARMLATSVSLSLREGDKAQAAADLRTLARFHETLTNEPLLISQLVRIAGSYIALTRFWEALQMREWTEAELTEIQASLKPPDYAGGMARSLEMERAMALMAFDKLRTGKIRTGAVFDSDVSAGPLTMPSLPTNVNEAKDFIEWHFDHAEEVLGENVVGPIWRFAWLDQSMAHYLRVNQDFIDAARQQARNRKLDTAWTEKFVRMVGEASGYDRLRFALTYLLMPALETAMPKALRLDTFHSLAVTAFALERFRLKHGRYPEHLVALVPEFLPALPIDSMDGQPLRYRLNADGSFVLYSVGDDQKDDGGDPTPRDPKQTLRDIWAGRDDVWPRPATTEEIEAFEKQMREKSGASP